MQLQDQNVLFFTRTMALGGTENVILHLCEVLNPLVNKIVVCSAGGVNEARLNEMGIKHYTIPDIENKSIHNLTLVPHTLKKIIKKEKITLIHTHHRMAAFYVQMLLNIKDIPLINTSHTAFYDKKALTHIAFHRFNMIACGEGVKKSLVEGLGFDSGRVKVICNGVKRTQIQDIDSINEIEKAKMDGKQVFAVIGRLSKEKGVEYIVKAIPLIKRKDVLCVIVGNGPEETKLKTLVTEQKVEDRCIFLGYRTDVVNIISQVDFLVQPSLQEGLPLVPIEAFSAGKTVIGTRIDGTSEIINNKENGILVPPGDEKELAKAIDYMCNIDRCCLERNAIETYETKYSFEVFSNEYIKYYEALN